MLDIEDLRTVRAIAENGSLARAARILGIGQPALTRRLAGLETRLRGRLFLRDRRGVLPTDLARLLLAEAAPLLAGLEALETRLRSVRDGRAQDLVLAAGTWAAESIGAAAAARLLAAQPQLRVTLRAGNWLEIPNLLRDRKATLGLLDLTQLGTPADLVTVPLDPQPCLFLVRPGHPLLGQPHPGLSDIMVWPLIFPGHSPEPVQAAFAAARAACPPAAAPHPAFPALVIESAALGLALLRDSDAVAAAPGVLAAPALARDEAVALPFHEPWMMTRWGVIHRRGQKLGPPEQALLDMLRETAAIAGRTARETLARLGL